MNVCRDTCVVQVARVVMRAMRPAEEPVFSVYNKCWVALYNFLL